MLMERLTTWILGRFVRPAAPSTAQLSIYSPVETQVEPRVETRVQTPAAPVPAWVAPTPAYSQPAPAFVPARAVAAPVEPVYVEPERQSAVSILRNEPNLSAEELAALGGVTLSYARSLIRRQQSKPLTAAFRSKAAPASLPLPQKLVRELPRQPEPVAQPRAAQAAAASCGSRRTQVLDGNSSGAAPVAIAEQLLIPQGEVDFILKIEQLKKASKKQQNPR